MTKIRIEYLGHLHTQCTHEESGAVIETDAPKDNEGRGEAFSPTDLFATSLGSCMLTIMGIAARKMGIELKDLHTEVEKVMVNQPVRRIGKLTVKIYCSMPLEASIRTRLEKAAMQCPVHASLHPDIEQEIEFFWR
jgi:putative redox protein